MAQDGNARRFLPCYGAQRLASPRTQLNTFPLSSRIPAEEKKKGYINISGDVYSYSCRGKKKGNIDISGDNQEVLLVGASACVKEKPKIGFAVHRIQDLSFVFYLTLQNISNIHSPTVRVGNVIPKLIFLILPTR